jgi:hypothetical protein
MKPSELANSLRRIAAAIDASKKPDRRLVARDLKKILSAIKSRFFEVNAGNLGPYFVIVNPEDERVWEDTKEYLKDCELVLEIYEVNSLNGEHGLTPGELSDELAPRDH